jgi:hypothetical protein
VLFGNVNNTFGLFGVIYSVSSKYFIVKGLFSDNWPSIRKIPQIRGDLKKGYIYILKFSNERLKIGLTNNLVTRLNTHKTNGFNYGGAHIEEVAIFGPFLNKYQIETEFKGMIVQSELFKVINDEWYFGDFNELVKLAIDLVD